MSRLFKNPNFIAIIIVVIAYLYYVMPIIISGKFIWSTSLDVLNGFGDYFSGTTAPFLSIISIYLTYKVFSSQNREIRQADFRHMFQFLFDTMEKQKGKISVRMGTMTKKNGEEALNVLNDNFRSFVEYYTNVKKVSNPREIAKKSFAAVYDDANGSFTPYMKTIHNLLKIIDKYCIEENKETYAHMVRAQMNHEDLQFMLYNAIGKNEFLNFKMRIEKFTMLQDLYETDKVEKSIYDLYAKKAYKE
jgi:hypothetical protein